MKQHAPAGRRAPSGRLVMAGSESGNSAIIFAIFWFSLPPIGFNLQVAAGRRIVLSFLGSPANPRVKQELAARLCGARQFDEDRLRPCAKSAISPWPKPWR